MGEAAPAFFLAGEAKIETVSQCCGGFTGVVTPRLIRTIPPATTPCHTPPINHGQVGRGGEWGRGREQHLKAGNLQAADAGGETADGEEEDGTPSTTTAAITSRP